MSQFSELATKHPHFLYYNQEDGVLEMFLDHHMMSTFRQCEAKFVEEHLTNAVPRGERFWNLEFGLWVHDCLKPFYDSFKKDGKALLVDDWTKQGLRLWDEYDLDYYKPDPLKIQKLWRTDNKKYHAFGGKQGAAAFLIHYYAFYMDQRYRVVATEIAFGRKHDVLLGNFRFFKDTWWDFGNVKYEDGIEVRVYLTGRIDLLVDNTYKIGPVDHKTTANFDGYEGNDYDPHEGITGYIFTTDAILSTMFPDNPHKICRDGWIFHISSNALDQPRFKATLVTKTKQQLEDYRARQLHTAKRILNVLMGDGPDWNTAICNNIYNRMCPYHELHRQPAEQRQAILKQFYVIREAWNPEQPPDLRIKATKEKEPIQV